MAAIGNAKSRKSSISSRGSARRVSPLKPGLRGARNWATAQIRSASYSKARMTRLIMLGVAAFLFVLWMALWLGGFIPDIRAAGDRFTKQRLMSMGFVVSQVDIVGEGRISEDEVRAQLGVRPGDYLFDMDVNTAQKRVQELSWVNTAVVRRLWPNRIVVYVNEKTPYALWQNKGQITLVDNKGAVIENAVLSDFTDLPFVVGAGAGVYAEDMTKNLSQYSALRGQVKALVYVGERRWDILTHDGLRIMLPENGTDKALGRLEAYHLQYGLLGKDLAVIDLRVNGRMYLTASTQRAGKKNRA